jgi:hypothetical protein
MHRVRHAIFLSTRDAELAKEACPAINAIVVPPLFDYPAAVGARRPDPDGRLDLGFLANFGWWPNRRALHWFLKNVLPYIPETMRLHLFGEQSESAAPEHPRIVGHGFVPKIHDVWARCDVMICPVFSGGGVSVKFAEIIYNGMPVVASSFATRGLPVTAHPSIVLLDRAEDWVQFLRSPAARTLAFRRGPTHLARVFDLEAHVAPMQAFIGEAASDTSSA